MRNKIITITMGVIGSLIGVITVSAQDLRFTQVFANPMKLNPAAMGINPDLKFILHYRSQWSALDNGYTTYSFSTLYPLYTKDGKEKLDIGVNVLQDKVGAFSTIDVSLALGTNLQISRSGHISFSLLGGYVQKSLSTTDLTFDNQYVQGTYNSSNPNNEITVNEKTGYPDAGFGVIWYYNPAKDDNTKLNAYLGASAFHLNQINESLTSSTGKLPTRISYQGGIKILGVNKVDFNPNVIVNTQNGSLNFAAGLYMNYFLSDAGKMIIGTWFRKKDAIALHLGFEHKSFSFGYSYDVAISDIQSYLAGANGHEISLAYKINMAEKKGAKFNPSFLR